MSYIRKLAWYGPAVAIAAVAAVAMLLASPAQKAHAAPPTAVTFTAPVQAAGLTETWTVGFTSSATGALAATNSVTITFPAGFTIPAAPTCATTATGWSAAGAATCSTAGQVVTFTTVAQTLAASTASTLTLAGIKNPAAGSLALAGFTVSTTTDTTAASPAANVGIWDLTVTKAPTSVTADGASTVSLTMTASQAAGNTGATGQITYSIDNGTFTGAEVVGGTDYLVAAVTIATDGKTATGLVQAAVGVTAVTGLQVKAPTTVSTGTIQVKVTPAGGGQAVLVGITTVSFTAPAAVPGAPTSGSVTAPATLAVSATGAAAVTATFLDANGNAPIPGGTLTVTTTLGVLSAPTNGACTNQSCAGTMPSTGIFAVTLTGGGVAGTGTITFTSGGISATKALTVSGGVDTLAVAIQSDVDGAGALLTFVSAATPNAASFTVVGTNVGGRLSVTAKDTAGNRVPGAVVTAAFTPASCGAAPAVTTAGTGTTDVILAITTASLTAPAGTACSVTVTSGTKTATATFTVGGTFSSTTSTITVVAADIAPVTSGPITVTLKDSAGNLVGDGTQVTLVVSDGALVTGTANTVNGVASFTYVSPATAQSINATALVGTKTASVTFKVGTPAPAPGTGGFTGTAPAAGKVGLLVTDSAATAASEITALGTAGCTVSALAVLNNTTGVWSTYIVGAPAVVNAAFPASLAATTPFFARCS